MGYAYDTVLAFATVGAASPFPTALAAAPGDSLTVRGVVSESKVSLEAVIYGTNAVGQKARIVSPLLHDNVTGLTFAAGENPAAFLVPAAIDVALSEQDTLSLYGAATAASTILMGLQIQYENVRGVQADLYRWSDLRNDVKSFKAIEVDLAAIAVGAWTDTLITQTENQLHADSSYAVVGYSCSQSVDLVGVKGIATGNLRYCGPGASSTLDLTSYFIYMGEEQNIATVPVFQANDRNSFYVSAANHAAIGGGTAIVSLIVAELKNKK